MVDKQITNAGQAWSVGATWNVINDSGMTQTVAHLLNATGLILYQGDIVCLDATGTLAKQPTTATLPTAIGVVGGSEQFGGVTAGLGVGAGWPLETAPNRTDTATVTSGSATVTDASVQASDLGRAIVGTAGGTAVFASGAVIISVTANTSFVSSVAASGGGSATSVTIGDAASGVPSPNQAGWVSTTQFAIGAEVPVVIQGFGRINVAAATLVVANDSLLGTNNSFAATRVAAGAIVAAQIGLSIAVALEAFAARDLSLTNIGITGHETIRALIGKY